MLELTEQKFKESLPFIFEEELDSEDPTIINMHILSQEKNAQHLAELVACNQKRGNKEYINHERFLSRRRLKILDSIDSVEHVRIEGEIKDKIEDQKEILAFIKRLDNSQLDEIYEASDNYNVLSERAKKKLPSLPGTP